MAPGRARLPLLLLTSYVFYAHAGAADLLILLSVTLLAYLGGHYLVLAGRWGLATSVVAALSFLVVFKSLAFIGDTASVTSLTQQGESYARVLIPVGLSFFTLQAVSYLVDVRRGHISPIKSLPLFALYLAFFPKLLAGPIERSERLTPQLASLPTPTATDIYVGLKTVLWGYFCKLLVADRLAGIAQQVLDQPGAYSRGSLLLAIYAYSFRFYFDFYGYTCIAIGVARSFGVRLSSNFNNPYLATSVREFWRRWHITLMNWLRDYVYIPLGGNRHGPPRTAAAVLSVFVVSGLWHGASPAFILWGLVHAVGYGVGAITARLGRALRPIGVPVPATQLARALRVFLCFSFVSIAWLPFAVGDLASIGAVVGRLFLDGAAHGAIAASPYLRAETLFFSAVLVAAFSLSSIGVVDRMIETVPSTRAQVGRELAMVNVMGVLILLYGDLGTQGYIYFRF